MYPKKLFAVLAISIAPIAAVSLAAQSLLTKPSAVLGTAKTSFQNTGTTAAPSDSAATASRDDEIVTLEEFQVRSTSSNRDDYVASEAISGTRTGEKIVDLPFTVSVLTDSFLEDFQLLTDADQLVYFPSFSSVDAGVGKLRGFQPTKLRDGFSRAGPTEIANTRQIEVIMGPQSVLYGQTSPGGIINYISKKPRMQSLNHITAAVGGYNYQRYEFDSTGPLMPGKLYYLVDIFHRENGSATDFARNKVTSYNIALTAKLTPMTSLTINWEQQFRGGPIDAGIPVLMLNSRAVTGDSTVVPFARAGALATSSVPTYTVGPYMPLAGFNRIGPYQNNYQYYDSLNILLEHRFNQVFSGRLSFQRYTQSTDIKRWTSGLQYVQWSEVSTNPLVRAADITAYNNSSYKPTSWLTERKPYIQNTEDVTTALQADFLARFYTGKIKHAVLLAFDYAWEKYNDNQWQMYTDRAYSDVILSDLPIATRFIDPSNPYWYNVDYTKVNRHVTETDRNLNNGGATTSYRLFLFKDRLIFLAGGRYNVAESDITVPSFTNGITNAKSTSGHGSENVTTYSTGLSYKVLGDGLVVYGSYSTSFEPTIAVDHGLGQAKKSERGKGGEFGLKGTFWGERIGYTAAAFEITKYNISDDNPAYDSSMAGTGIPEFITTGKVRVRGVEAALSASLTKGLTIMGNIGYLDSKTLESDNPEEVGKSFAQTPPMTGSLTLRYRFTEGWLKGLRAGVSYVYTGPRVSTYQNLSTSIKVAYLRTPSIGLTNAFIGYKWRMTKRISNSINLNVSNLLDKDYITSSNPPKLGNGRSFSMTYQITF